MTLISKPTHDPKLTRWWWRTLREWVYDLVDPLWAAFRSENSDEIALANVTGINDVSASELSILDGLTATNTELNKLSGLTAEASELNKADRTEVDGVAEASKNVVLNPNKDFVGKRYDINRSLLDSVANRPYLWFDGVNDNVSAAENDNLNIGTNDGTVEALVCLPNGAAEEVRWYQRWENTDNYILFRFNVSFSQLEGICKIGGAVLHQAKCNWEPEADTIYHVVWVIHNGSANNLYINAQQKSLASDNHIGGDISIAAGVGFFPNYQGQMWLMRQWNRALSENKVKSLTSGAPLNYADVGANQTDKVTNGEDWTGAGGSTPPNSWSDTGSGTAIYIIRDNTPVQNFGDDKALEFSASGGSKTLYQSVAQVGKRYRISFVYRNLDGSSSSYVVLGGDGNKVTLQNTGISGDGVVFEQELIADGTDLKFFVDSSGTLQIDHVQIIQVGCVAAYLPGGVTHAQWQDASGNELHGSVNGALPLNLPSNHVARHIKPGITGDTTLSGVIPGGYRVKSMVTDVSGASSGMILNVGTSSGGSDVVNGQDISSNGLFDLTVVKNIFSLSTAQSLYVNDDGGTAWSGVSVDLYIEMERVK